jgi:predicted transcriptional regulator
MSEWHPLLATVEVTPTVWELRAPDGRVYGRVALRRTADGPRYRCEHETVLIGWATSLRVACERVHGEYLRAHGPSGGPVARWPRP